jgi:hypothetical protein
MRAVVYNRYGPPDVLRLEEVERPVPKEDEVLVKIHATTVTRTDCGLRAAKPFISRFFTGLRPPCGAGPQLGLSGRFRKARGQPGLHIPHLSNLIFSYTLGGFIHLLLVAAIIVVLIRIIQGRRPI